MIKPSKIKKKPLLAEGLVVCVRGVVVRSESVENGDQNLNSVLTMPPQTSPLEASMVT